MEAWDAVCPRCQGKGVSSPQTSPKVQGKKPAAAATEDDVKKLAAKRSSTQEDEDEDAWWQLLGGGIFFWAVAGYYYWSLTSIEATGRTWRMRWWLAIPYQLGGKWPIVLAFVVLGVLAVALGILSCKRRN
jgi:hypothetical protein